MRAPRPKYLLFSLFAAIFFCAFVSLYVSKALSHPEAKWIPYTSSKLEDCLEDGNPVLLIVGSRIGMLDVALAAFDNEQVLHAADDSDTKMMLLEYRDWNAPEVKNIFSKFGHTKYPIAIFFEPNQPPKHFLPYSSEQIIMAIENAGEKNETPNLESSGPVRQQ